MPTVQRYYDRSTKGGPQSRYKTSAHPPDVCKAHTRAVHCLRVPARAPGRLQPALPLGSVYQILNSLQRAYTSSQAVRSLTAADCEVSPAPTTGLKRCNKVQSPSRR